MKATATIEISRPIDDVFAVVSDVEQMGKWVDGVGEATRVGGGSDGVAVGDRYETTYSYGGRETPMTFEVTTCEPPTRFGMTAPEGPFAFDGLVELREAGGRTHVTNTIETGSDGTVTAVMFTLFRPVMRRLMARQLRGELRELKALLEADATQTDERPSQAPDA